MDEEILLSYGSGGKLTHMLLNEIVLPAFANPILKKCEDAAIVPLRGRCAVTTDSFVIQPLFFPGGDIGKLAVCGTVNDLAVMGARPLYLTAACIIEEGLQTAVLKKIIESMARAAAEAKIMIVGGDIKVVEKAPAIRYSLTLQAWVSSGKGCGYRLAMQGPATASS